VSALLQPGKQIQKSFYLKKIKIYKKLDLALLRANRVSLKLFKTNLKFWSKEIFEF